MAEREWRVGELARATGITVRALHHYDRLGLLTPSSRTGGGHRCYTESDVRRLHRIIALREFGFALDEIGRLLDAEPAPDPRDLVHRQLAAVDERIARALRLRSRLLGVLGGLDRAVEPSATEFLRLIEETITMNQPLSLAEFERMSRQRAEYASRLSPEELAAMSKRRADAAAALSPEERERMAQRRRGLLPPGAIT
ncbi:MerR family transcriptional regulator [Nocardia pseudobrasiliensis]|uniref:DNA-binding transcriptional MerR regulator n=1 Tax=Nocardia pseudobrasiliensis TaxID=45979 RepID=A0A370IAY2_9NOCA|nr:MerR family transcriptional regulator [Nocardia pseudobrasiliensis]RDI67770.1 DNA-binding transcriptional MerR regulator [Nocardia pseudobrasiliensis]